MGIRLLVLGLLFSASAAAAEKWAIRNDAKVLCELKSLAKKSKKVQLATVRKSGVCVEILDSGRKVPKGFFVWKDAEKPTALLSKVTSKAALMGKTMCKGEHRASEKCTTIFLASDAPASTLLHEYLHVKQIEKDAAWCELSKNLWTREATEAEAREPGEREWDVHVALWDNRESLGFDAQDTAAVGGELLELVPARASYDKETLEYVKKARVESELVKAIQEYQRRLKR